MMLILLKIDLQAHLNLNFRQASMAVFTSASRASSADPNKPAIKIVFNGGNLF